DRGAPQVDATYLRSQLTALYGNDFHDAVSFFSIALKCRELLAHVVRVPQRKAEERREQAARALVGVVDRARDRVAGDGFAKERIGPVPIHEEIDRVPDPGVELRRDPEVENPERVELLLLRIVRAREPLLGVAVEARRMARLVAPDVPADLLEDGLHRRL